MKKVLITCMALVTLGTADGYTQADRILDMQKMAQAMQDIQSGFFYNNLDIVTAGANDLKNTIIKVGPTTAEQNTKDVYEKWMNDNSAMTGRTQKRIQRYAKDIVEHFKAGDAQYALNIYNRVTAECMKCHTSLRKW
ncbi:MAG TPA: cytochrome C [Epsilonproteobacteria bacterium]|nr:cytochrome C [Campylobacterota bacterium]